MSDSIAFDALDVAAVNARSAYNRALDDNLALAGDNQAKATLLVQREAVIEQQAARIAVLEGAGTVPDPPPVPAPARLLLGATLNRRNGLTDAQSLAAWEAVCGPCGVARVFISGPPTKANVAAAIAPHIGKRAIVLSYKGECANDVFLSIPATVFPIWLVKYHEPENDGGTHTPAWFKQVQDEEITQIQGLHRPDLKPAFVLMGWVDNDADRFTTSTQWFPTITAGVTMFLDPYDSSKTVFLPQYVMNSLSLWRAFAGASAPWGIAEIGTQRRGTDGAGWITEALTFARAEHAVAACWFNSAVHPSPLPWWLDDPAMQSAWKAQTAL